MSVAVVSVRGVGVVLVLAQPVDVHPREGEGLSVQQQTGTRPDHKPELTVTQRLHTLTNYTILAEREQPKKASFIVRIFSGWSVCKQIVWLLAVQQFITKQTSTILSPVYQDP